MIAARPISNILPFTMPKGKKRKKKKENNDFIEVASNIKKKIFFNFKKAKTQHW